MSSLSCFKAIATLVVLMTLSELVYAQDSSPRNLNKGLTFTSFDSRKNQTAGVFAASCDQDPQSQKLCPSHTGDTLCSTSIPLLCILDIDAPVPETIENSQYWTGGVLALSSPVAGEQFSRLSDANAYCEATFGKYWRVASFHDGGGQALSGYGVTQATDIRFWVDIKSQPKANCWSR